MIDATDVIINCSWVVGHDVLCICDDDDDGDIGNDDDGGKGNGSVK